MTKRSPFKYFKTSPEVIRLAVMIYVRFPLSLRNVEDLLHERGIDVSHETIRFWWNRFGPMFASEIRRRRVQQLRAFSRWQWHVDEVFVKINGERHYLWRAVDHEGEVLESVVTKRRNKRAALKILRKLMRRYGQPEVLVTDRFASYKAALRDLGCDHLQSCGRWLNNRFEKGQCSAFGSCEVCRSSPPCILLFSTTSTKAVASQAEIISNRIEPLLWPSGAVSARHKGQRYCPGRDEFEFV